MRYLKVNVEVLFSHFTLVVGSESHDTQSCLTTWSYPTPHLFYQSMWLAYCLTRSIENTGEFEASWVNNFSMSVNPSFHEQKNVCLQNFPNYLDRQSHNFFSSVELYQQLATLNIIFVLYIYLLKLNAFHKCIA